MNVNNEEHFSPQHITKVAASHCRHLYSRPSTQQSTFLATTLDSSPSSEGLLAIVLYFYFEILAVVQDLTLWVLHLPPTSTLYFLSQYFHKNPIHWNNLTSFKTHFTSLTKRELTQTPSCLALRVRTGICRALATCSAHFKIENLTAWTSQEPECSASSERVFLQALQDLLI